MLDQRFRVTAALYLLGDVAGTVAAYFATWYLRFESGWIPLGKNDVPDFTPYLQLLPFILLLWPVVFYFHGLYQSRRGHSRVDEIFTLLVAVLLASVLLQSITFWFRLPDTPPFRFFSEQAPDAYFNYSRGFIGLFFVVNLAFVGSCRTVTRSLLRYIRLRGHNIRRILVAGAGKLGKEITQKLKGHRELGLEVVGFVDDDPGKAGRSFFGVPVLGTLKEVSRIVSERGVDQIMIALPLEAHRKILRLIEQVGSECVEIRLVPDILQYATLRAKLEDLDGTPVINLSQVPLQGWNSLVKRAMDLILSGALMLLLLPLLPLIALAIKLEDRGPVFYRQERMGLDGRPFMILKLRSMRVNAESSTGPIWASKDDPRRTRVGSFLRRTSLDELPQLWNVFKGEMSLVGPRPERPAFVREFRHKIPNYMLRHRVKSGITGWAQVHGWRGNTSIRKRIQYDLYYIENWTLGLDIKILWMTLRHGLTKNAY